VIDRRAIGVLAAAVLLSASWQASAQPISIDRGLKAAGLWCFPLAQDPKVYVYLPNQVRLASDAQGRPQFSLLRYVTTVERTADHPDLPATSEGGAVLHVLVELDTPEPLVRDAERALRRTLDDTDIVVRGQMLLDSARYTVVSSLLGSAGDPPDRKLLTTGEAPVLENNRLPLTFALKPREATLMMESFAMNTRDLSIVFDMTFQGLTDNYDATLTVDWAEVHKTQGFDAGGSIYYVGADIEVMFDDLHRRHAIDLKSSGGDDVMERYLDVVYARLLDLLFRPIEPEKVPADKRGGLMEALGGLIDPKDGALSSRQTTGFGLSVGYQLKDLKTTGTSVLTFNHRAAVQRHSYATLNVGELYGRYGSDPAFFKTVNTRDPVYQVREIHVAVDGALLPDFDQYINNVAVTVRKVHENGHRSDPPSLVFDRQAVRQDPPPRRTVTYGWDGDDDRAAWMRFDYRTRWSFKGGGVYEPPWVVGADAPMIDLFAPYERRRIQIVGERATLQALKVRSVVVEVTYDFFGEQRRHQVLIRSDKAENPQEIEITLPLNQFEYAYRVTWRLEGGGQLVARGKDSSGVLFIDELPAVQ